MLQGFFIGSMVNQAWGGGSMNWMLIIAILAGVVFLVAALRVFLAPIRLLLRLVVNSALGLVLLWLINMAGNSINLHIGLNPITAVVVGLLGIPGVLLLLAVRFVSGLS